MNIIAGIILLALAAVLFRGARELGKKFMEQDDFARGVGRCHQDEAS